MYKPALDPDLIIKDMDIKKIEKEMRGTQKNHRELKKACSDFEAIFIEKLWKEMKNTVTKDGMFSDPISGQYLDMFDYNFAQKISEAGGIGLSKFLYNNLVRQLEEKSGETDVMEMKVPKSNETFPITEKETDTLMERVDDIAKEIETRDSGANSNSIPEKFIIPVMGRITSKFGYRRDPFLGEIKHHNGIDIAAPKGTPIKAATGGKVVFAGKKHGYGNVVIIKNNRDFETIYAHNSENLVKTGDRVKAGDIIARVGATGRATGPHLHFEVRRHEKPVDPIYYIYPSRYAKTGNPNMG